MMGDQLAQKSEDVSSHFNADHQHQS